ncbi:MAG TPA: YceI family protein [Acidimicrobiales bacterium]|nr:YceI family protein [Acidimicrobiales bacterium]
MNTTETLTRTVSGSDVPAPGTYGIDPAHSGVEFTVRHLGLSKVKGRFVSFDGEVVIADDVAESTTSVRIEAASFETGNADRDGHVKSADFLDVEVHPSVDFETRAVRRDSDGWKLDGSLTIKGVTRPVTLDVDFEGAGVDPWGGQRIAFSASTKVEREEFGLTWNQALETGGVLVGKTVTIAIELQAVRQDS